MNIDKDYGYWIAACGGAEKPFTVNGIKWLYVWNPVTGQHGYLNMNTDIVETDTGFHPTVK